MALPKDMNFSQRLHAMGTSSAKANLTVAPNNGSSFDAGTGMMQFEIPGNQLGTFADLSSAYIACDITNSAAATNDVKFTNIGTMGLVSRLVVSTNTNKIICDISNKDMLDAIMIAKHGETTWLSSNASVMFGCGSSAVAGQTIAADGGVERYLIPLHLMGIDELLFPLSGQEHLRFQVYLQNAPTTFVVAAGKAVVDADIKLTSVMLHYDTVQLNNDEFSQLVKDLGGKFTLTVPCWQNQDATITNTDTQVSTTLGFSKRRAKRLLVAQRNTAFLTDDEKCSYAMDRGLVTTASLKLNGKEVKTQSYSVSNNGPEVYAEAIKSNGGRIMDIHASNATRTTVNVAENAAGTGDATVGRFFIEFDLQNGLEVGDDVVSGINIASGNFTLALTKSDSTTANRQLDVYMEYWNELELDVVGSNTWTLYN